MAVTGRASRVPDFCKRSLPCPVLCDSEHPLKQQLPIQPWRAVAVSSSRFPDAFSHCSPILLATPQRPRSADRRATLGAVPLPSCGIFTHPPFPEDPGSWLAVFPPVGTPSAVCGAGSLTSSLSADFSPNRGRVLPRRTSCLSPPVAALPPKAQFQARALLLGSPRRAV